MEFKNVRFDWSLNVIQKYRLFYTALLTMVPVTCSFILTLLLIIFAKLNLYFLEARGLIINPMVRDGYYVQLLLEIVPVFWYFVALIALTFLLSYIVMGWAMAPFKNAEILLRTALDKPELLRSQSKWLSESWGFDKTIWTLAKQVQEGKANPEAYANLPRVAPNLPFLGKFIFIYTLISFMTGYILGIFFNTIYYKIVSLALQLIATKEMIGHYFLAQEEILSDALMLMIVLSFAIYVVIGRSISNYMGTMIYVFCRAIRDQRYPLQLRRSDVYFSLADAVNAASQKINTATVVSQQKQK